MQRGPLQSAPFWRRLYSMLVGKSRLKAYLILIRSSICQWSPTETTELAAIMPLAATAGMPMPGKVLSPHM